jgi:hypothetical protein
MSLCRIALFEKQFTLDSFDKHENETLNPGKVVVVSPAGQTDCHALHVVDRLPVDSHFDSTVLEVFSSKVNVIVLSQHPNSNINTFEREVIFYLLCILSIL